MYLTQNELKSNRAFRSKYKLHISSLCVFPATTTLSFSDESKSHVAFVLSPGKMVTDSLTGTNP